MEEGEESEYFRFGSVHGLTNVTVQVGTIAYMHCPVVNLGEREVSIVVFSSISSKFSMMPLRFMSLNIRYWK